ncbi:MAG: hypothetical protein HEQ22_03450 [Sphingopyxis sp.]|uniref:DUF6950 family protein n=1 Tax=Sphingopyxis sp. TaxID=1908224 RepID=UPI003D81012A
MAGLLTTAAPIGAPDAVAAEIHRWAAEPFDLGDGNCGLSVIDYVARATGQPAPHWLRRLGRRGAARLMRDDARFERVASAALAAMQCSGTDSPVRGDVALVLLAGSGLTACICASSANGGLWAARGDRAAVLARGTVRKAWRVRCRRP